LQKGAVFTLVATVADFCRMIFKTLVLVNITYFQATRTSLQSGNDDVTNVNFDFKQVVTAVSIHAAINPL